MIRSGRAHNFEGTMIPFRFLLMVGHTIAVIMLFSTKKENIKSSIPSNYTQSEYDDVESTVQTVLVFYILFEILQLLGFFIGLSMFSYFMNSIHIVLDASCMITLGLYMARKWHVDVLYVVFGVIAAPLTAMEIVRGVMIIFMSRWEF